MFRRSKETCVVLTTFLGGCVAVTSASLTLPWMMWGIAFVFGALNGLLHAPLLLKISLQRPLRFALATAFGPVFIVAWWASLMKQSSSACLVLTTLSLWINLLAALLITRPTKWISVKGCGQCGYPRPGGASLCPECGSDGPETTTHSLPFVLRGEPALISGLIFIALGTISLCVYAWEHS